MSAREELAEIIRDGVDTWRTPLEAADAILGRTGSGGMSAPLVAESATTPMFNVPEAMSSMAEVVEESLRLLSEVRSISREDLAAHQAAELAKAGYGNMADAWDEGYTSGHSRAMRMMSDEPKVEPGTNPYRSGQ